MRVGVCIRFSLAFLLGFRSESLGDKVGFLPLTGHMAINRASYSKIDQSFQVAQYFITHAAISQIFFADLALTWRRGKWQVFLKTFASIKRRRLIFHFGLPCQQDFVHRICEFLRTRLCGANYAFLLETSV